MKINIIFTVVANGLLLKVEVFVHTTAIITWQSQGPQLEEDHKVWKPTLIQAFLLIFWSQDTQAIGSVITC